MKQALTILLTAAYALVALPALGEDAGAGASASAGKTDSADAKVSTGSDSATPKKAKKEKKKKEAAADADKAKDPDATAAAKKDGDTTAKKDGDTAAKKDSDTADKKDSATTKTSKTKKEPKGNFASRTASFLAGAIVGTPIAYVREIYGETKIATKDLVGETDNWFLIVPALPLGFIGGMVSAPAQGIMFGVKNAWEGSIDEPFSAEAFSLADELEK